MAGSITLPQIVLDLEEEDRKAYEALSAPKNIVVSYGYMKLVAELPYDGSDKPGCGSKLVIRTNRGIELAKMLTTTCSNGGCGSSVTRKEILQYIDNSGGKDFPFTSQGKVLRIATVEDLKEQERLDARKMELILFARERTNELKLQMRIAEVEQLLGGDRIIFHFTSEQWVDFRELVRILAQEYQTRIELHQVNPRDEARLVADYEKCGQHCCCKQFLKVLKPVSMKSAKVQKATLDPTKISGRCGRLMCCLRYEDETYDSLKKKLPYKQTRVITDDGPGTVLDTQILTQLCLIMLDSEPMKPKAYPVENIRVMTKEEILQHKATVPVFNKPGQDRDGAAGNAQGKSPAPGNPGNPGSPGNNRPPRNQGNGPQRGPAASGGGTSGGGGSGGRERPQRQTQQDHLDEPAMDQGDAPVSNFNLSADEPAEDDGLSSRDEMENAQPQQQQQQPRYRPAPGRPVDPSTGQPVQMRPNVPNAPLDGVDDDQQDDGNDQDGDDQSPPSDNANDANPSAPRMNGQQNRGPRQGQNQGQNQSQPQDGRPRGRRRRRRGRRGGGAPGNPGSPGSPGSPGNQGGGGGNPTAPN